MYHKPVYRCMIQVHCCNSVLLAVWSFFFVFSTTLTYFWTAFGAGPTRLLPRILPPQDVLIPKPIGNKHQEEGGRGGCHKG